MWSQVVVADKTPLMMDMMKMELEKFEKIKDTFVNQFTATDFEDIHQVRNNIDDDFTVWSRIETTLEYQKKWIHRMTGHWKICISQCKNMLGETGFDYVYIC